MSDSISRADAIRWVKTECNPYGKPTLDFESGKKVMEHLVQMPSAEPKTGEWKYLQGSIGSYMTMSCPFCGETFNNVPEWKYNYCPSCGTRMKGGDDE